MDTKQIRTGRVVCIKGIDGIRFEKMASIRDKSIIRQLTRRY
jgi:hypothetical protein